MSWPARLTAVFTLVLLLLAAAWRIHTKADANGYARARTEFDSQALAESEARRATESALMQSIQEIDRAHQIEKKRLATVVATTAGQLRELQTALDRSSAQDSATACRVNDAPRAIASECPSALAALDAHAAKLGSRLSALQVYVVDACQPRSEH